MTEISRPWTSTSPGDAGAYSEDNWALLQRYLCGSDGDNPDSGPITGSGVRPDPGLTVTQRGAGANMSVDVSAGSAMVNGTFYNNSAVVNLVIAANASGNPRVDVIVLNKDWSAQTVRLLVVQGTPAGSPVPTAMIQTALTQWQIPLADIAVANGAVSITNANITPRGAPINVADGTYLQGVLNNSGVVLAKGDVVILDTSADRACTTTTTGSNKLVLGVVAHRVAIGGYCRVQTKGLAYVQTNAAVTRGQGLTTSTTAKQAQPQAYGIDPTQFAVALQTTGGAGLALCLLLGSLLNIPPVIIKADPTELTDSNSAAEVTLYTATIPGRTIGANDSIEFEFWISFLQNSGGARTITARVKYGATTILTISIATTAGGTAYGFSVRGFIKNAGATNSQKAIGIAFGGSASGTSSNGGSVTGTAAEDSTADKTLALTFQSDANTATQTYTQQQAYVRVHKNQ